MSRDTPQSQANRYGQSSTAVPGATATRFIHPGTGTQGPGKMAIGAPGAQCANVAALGWLWHLSCPAPSYRKSGRGCLPLAHTRPSCTLENGALPSGRYSLG